MGDCGFALPEISINQSDLLAKNKRENLLKDFACSSTYSMIVGPACGIAQLADATTGSKLLPSVQILPEPEPASFGSTCWHARQLGSAAGMVLPFLLLHKGVSRMGSLLSGQVESRAESELAASVFSGCQRPNWKLNTISILQSAATGFLYNALLVPVDSEADFTAERFRNACTGAITFASMGASAVGVGALDRRGILSACGPRLLRTGIFAGIPAGVANAESQSLLNGKGFASSSQVAESAYGFAFVGGALSIASLALDARHPTPVTEKSNAESIETPRLLPRNCESVGISWYESVIDDYIPKKEQKYWRKMVEKFEQRSHRERIPYAQIDEAICNLDRLLKGSDANSSSGVNPKLCNQLTREVLENIAFPYHIDQGSHPTCVFNAMENIIASNHPGKYCKMVADLALDGKYYYGQVGISLPRRCLLPDAESRQLVRKDGNRCFASQLFQYYLVNLHWSDCYELSNSEEVTPGSVKYQPISDGANRASLYINNKLVKDTYVDRAGNSKARIHESPGIWDYQIVPLFRKIIPRGSLQVVDHREGIERWVDDNGKRTVKVITCVDGLRSVLKNSKPNSTICGLRSEELGGGEGWHAVVLRNYDPQSDSVYLDNSWGKCDDYSGKKGQRNRLSVERLFQYMKPDSKD